MNKEFIRLAIYKKYKTTKQSIKHIAQLNWKKKENVLYFIEKITEMTKSKKKPKKHTLDSLVEKNKFWSLTRILYQTKSGLSKYMINQKIKIFKIS